MLRPFATCVHAVLINCFVKPGSHSPLQFISKGLDGVEVRALGKPFLYGRRFVSGGVNILLVSHCASVLPGWRVSAGCAALLAFSLPCFSPSCLLTPPPYETQGSFTRSLSLALTLFLSPAALMDANGGVCGGKELTFMPLIRTCSPNAL